MGCWVGREARLNCFGGNGNSAEHLDGQWIAIHRGIIKLPRGTSALPISNVGKEEVSCPHLVTQLVNKHGANEEFKTLWGKIKHAVADVDPNDPRAVDEGLEKVLIDCASQMSRHQIELYLTMKGPNATEDVRWFIFVDRSVNGSYTPPESLIPSVDISGVRASFATAKTRDIDPEQDIPCGSEETSFKALENGTEADPLVSGPNPKARSPAQKKTQPEVPISELEAEVSNSPMRARRAFENLAAAS